MMNKQYLITYICNALPNSKLSQVIEAKNRDEAKRKFDHSTSTSICKSVHTILVIERLKD